MKYAIGTKLVSDSEWATHEWIKVIHHTTSGAYVAEGMRKSPDRLDVVVKSEAILDDYYKLEATTFRIGKTYQYKNDPEGDTFRVFEIHANDNPIWKSQTEQVLARKTLANGKSSMTLLVSAEAQYMEEVK